MEEVQYRTENQIAILTIENPPVNALSAAVQENLRDAIARAMQDSSIDAVVLIGAGNTFVAGADIKQLERMANEGAVRSILPQVLLDMEAAPKPVVAAIHGFALGGGLEVALAAHYRIATLEARMGQPEVKLGIIPGSGGTQRLTRLAGVEAALEMCVFGEPIGAEEAKRLGIVDRIAGKELLEDAIQFAHEASRLGPRRTRDVADKLGTTASNALLFAAYRERARKTRRNLHAPLAAIDAVQAATELPFDEARQRERQLFERLLVSSQAKSLIHVFFAERAAGKPQGVVIPIQAASVVGAGTMGRGIAMCFANAGISVLLKDSRLETLESSMIAIESIYQGSVQKGRISSDEMKSRLSRIQPLRTYAGFDRADIIIEAVFEDIEVKRAVFAELGGLAKDTAILASNTSYLNIDEIALGCARPERVIGLHFFSPANVMRLLEVIPGNGTQSSVTATALALAKRLGKLAVVAGNCPGFIGNRMLRAYRREAQLLLEEGALPRQVDAALEEWGMAMGPFAVQDLAGIDIAMSSRHVLAALETPGCETPKVMEALYAQGRLGQKTNAGWYRYDERRNAIPDPDVEALIERASRESGTARRSITSEEIVERTIYALINEGARLLEEDCAFRASDIDLVYINGYGFPAYRGGPMHYADETGLRVVCQRIIEFRSVHGANWEPAPLLRRLAESSSSFSKWDSAR
jgi:3-hydroxyacyl-CoA dehydrogenase